MRLKAALPIVLACLMPYAAEAAADKYHVTDREKAACTVDALRLCMNSYPNEDNLLSCMKSNRASLSPMCLVAFDAGVRRRHL